MNQHTSSTNPFRNHHVHDDDGEEDMEPINVDFNEIPGLKDFSYDSIDMEYVANVVGPSNNIFSTTNDSQSPQNKRRKITTYDDYDGNCQEAVSPITTRATTAAVITPVPEMKSHVANVEFDPIPESQLESLILDCYCGTDNKEDHEGDTNDRNSTPRDLLCYQYRNSNLESRTQVEIQALDQIPRLQHETSFLELE